MMALLSANSPSRLSGTDWFARQVDERVERFEAPYYAAVPFASLDAGSADDVTESVIEVAEPTDDDETKHCPIYFDVVLRHDVPAFGSQTELDQSSADRAPTRFRLRAFSSRGSPLA